MSENHFVSRARTCGSAIQIPEQGYRFCILRTFKKYLYHSENVSLLWKMSQKLWKFCISDPDTEPKISPKPGSTEPVSQYFLTLDGEDSGIEGKRPSIRTGPTRPPHRPPDRTTFLPSVRSRLCKIYDERVSDALASPRLPSLCDNRRRGCRRASEVPPCFCVRQRVNSGHEFR